MDLNLSNAERRLLHALPSDGSLVPLEGLAGFASANEALQAAGGPVRHGLVRLSEETEVLHALSAEGLRYREAGLPERRAAKALVAAGGSLPLGELAGQAGLAPAEASVAVGWLRKKGWANAAKSAQGTLLTLSKGLPPPGPDEALLALLGPEPAPAQDASAVALLAQRGGLLVEQARTRRRLALTPDGLAFRRDLDPVASDATEVGQLTPELVARWSTMDAAEKARHHLRPFDFEVPVAAQHPGKAHPLTHIMVEIRAIFWSMGFQEIAGDYVESAFWNMDSLFIPQDHPARDMQDTFYLAEPARIAIPARDLDRVAAVHETGGNTDSTGWGGHFDREVAQRALLRTHTTNTTIRYLAKRFGGPDRTGNGQGTAPADTTASDSTARVFGLGRVFRKETMDATHLPEFTQIEGIVTEPGCTFNTLVGLCRHFFARMGFSEVRFRPAYFPYTEPSMEIDVYYNGRWMELGGCGIFRPEVTAPLGVPHNVLAWGFGLERLAMMRLGLKDIRDLYISDVQWLRETPVR